MDVSIIIPIYNAEAYLFDCINSVLSQKNLDIEIICIDDASNDLSYDIVKRIAREDNRVKVLRNLNNKGQAYARNRGIAEAKGRYIYFLDSDDELSDPMALQRLFKVAEQENVDCVCFDSMIEYENEGLKPLLAFRDRLNETVRPGTYDGNTYFECFFNNPGFSVAVWRQFWRKEYLEKEKISFCEETAPHEDLLFTFEAYLLAKSISYVPEVMHKYRFRDNSSSSGKIDARRIKSYQKIYIESLRFIDKHIERVERVNKKSIEQYLRSCLSPIYINYPRLITEGIIQGSNRENYVDIEEIYSDWILTQKYPLLERTFNRDEIEMIKNSIHVVIYGAGNYSVQLRQMLLDFGISDFIVCVTKKKGTETEIAEIKEYASNSVVILGTTSMYRKEMRKTALQYGFENIISLGDDSKEERR